MVMETTELGSTTFVQTDTNTFRQVVQRLTCGTGGSSGETAAPQGQVNMKSTAATTTTAANLNTNNSTRKVSSSLSSPSKLHERRKHMKMRPKIEIVKPTTTTFHSKPPSASSKPSLLSPCTVFSRLFIEAENKLAGSSPSPSPSPSPSDHQRGHRYQILMNTEEEEEKAIQERRFYLHPSPRGSRPLQLLTLFPLTSPTSTKNNHHS